MSPDTFKKPAYLNHAFVRQQKEASTAGAFSVNFGRI